MDLNLQITDMAGARPEHSTVIVNFLAAVRKQLKNSMCFLTMYNTDFRQKTGTIKRSYQTHRSIAGSNRAGAMLLLTRRVL